MKLIYKKTYALAAALFLSSGVHAAGLEDICINYNATGSTTVGIKLAATVKIWNKTGGLCGVVVAEPGNTTCYYYKLSTTCTTAATAADKLIVDNLYVNNVVAIPESLPYTLTGTSGTTAIENVTLANGAFAATAAVPSVITPGTLYTITAGPNIPG